MDKKDIIKSLIRYFTIASSQYMFIDSNNNEGIPKLALKVISKEIKTHTNVSFFSQSKEYFNEIFPNLNGNIKTDSKYSLGIHSLSFYLLDKHSIKTPPKDSDIIIFYPCDEMKEKELLKLIDKSPSMKKVLFIGKEIHGPYKTLKKHEPQFLSLKPEDADSYYANIREKLFDIR